MLAAAASGIGSFTLMQRAGASVAAALLRYHPGAVRVVVFCGPGNNGGDGYVAARCLAESGVHVDVFHLGDPAKLKGDAAQARTLFMAPTLPIEDYRPEAGDVAIDALFGAGLTRDVPQAVANLVSLVAEADVPALAVDLPSGIDGRTGRVLGTAFFGRTDHHLHDAEARPCAVAGARALRRCGGGRYRHTAADHPLRSTEEGSPRTALSTGRHVLQPPAQETHKYKRGHLVVFSGEATKTGAARMSAMAGLKAGADLVTIASPNEAVSENGAPSDRNYAACGRQRGGSPGLAAR